MMRTLRTLGVAVALVVGISGLAFGAAGCAGEANLSVGKAPPPPPPPPPPVADKDNDGVPDADDKCPDQAGPATNNGCPVDDDPDKDGIKGDTDKCPDKAGPAPDGCPPPPKVQIVGNKVQINDKIMFEEGKADIKPESNTLIENIANVLKEHAEINLVEVAGHADIDGTDGVNKPLTQKRSKAVMAALVKLGVAETRMRSEGYSFYCPINGDPGKTEEEKAKNRRVEIIILVKDGAPTDTKWGGCDAAEKKGMKAKALPAAPKVEAPKVDTKKPGPAVKKK